MIIEGWLANIPFCNLSEVLSSLTKLETLLQKWHCGKIYWKQLTDTEFQDLDCDQDNQIEGGELEAPICCYHHSDHRKKCPQVNHDEEEEVTTQSECSTPESKD